MKKHLALLLCLSMLVCLFAACGSTSPKSVLAKELDALKSGKYEEAGMLGDETFTEEDNAMLSAMFGKLSYTLGKETVDGDKATVEVTVEMVDMSAVFANYLTEALTHMTDTDWDATGERFVEMIAADDAPTATFSAVVHMTKTEEGWEIDETGNDDLLNAVTGGFFEYLTDLAGSFTE